jgi:hypothetical protein
VAAESILGVPEVRPTLLDNISVTTRSGSSSARPFDSRTCGSSTCDAAPGSTAGGEARRSRITLNSWDQPMNTLMSPPEDDDEVIDDEDFDEDAELDEDADDTDDDDDTDEEEEETWQVFGGFRTA